VAGTDVASIVAKGEMPVAWKVEGANLQVVDAMRPEQARI
jgi:hypothetical protein